MVYSCCVSSCKKEWYRGCGVTFHRIPRDENLALKWKIIIPGNVTKTSVICSRHFKEEDYVNKYRKTLIPNIVPSIFSTAHQNPIYISEMTQVNAVEAGEATVAQIPALSSTPSIPSYPEYPDVKFKMLPFYDVLAELVKPSTMMPLQRDGMQEGTYVFHLTPQQVTEIASRNASVDTSNKSGFAIQVQLRICRLESSCAQEDHFPPNISIKVNNKVCPLPKAIPTNKLTLGSKQPAQPVDISSLVNMSPTVPNHIQLTWTSDSSQAYVLSVSAVRTLSSAELLQRLKNKGMKTLDYTKSFLKENLLEDNDSEIATTSLSVSLMCPLGKVRISCPCRSEHCTHLQCFDASLFLQMNERKPTWLCPVCDLPAPYDSLLVDGYFQEVLASSRLPSDCSEIQLHRDGSWSINSVVKPQIKLQQTFEPVTLKSEDQELIQFDAKRAAVGEERQPKVTKAPIYMMTSNSEDEPIVKQETVSSWPSPTDSKYSFKNDDNCSSSSDTSSYSECKENNLETSHRAPSTDNEDDNFKNKVTLEDQQAGAAHVQGDSLLLGASEQSHAWVATSWDVLQDSGSDEGDEGDDNEPDVSISHTHLRQATRKTRDMIILEQERMADEHESETSEGAGKIGNSGPAASASETFTWSEDFTSFSGQKEVYLRTPDASFAFKDPTVIFLKFWDQTFMETIARETNEYAWQTISQLSDPDIIADIPNYLDFWTETTVEELYKYFAVLIYMSHSPRSKVHEYWDTGILEMPKFREIMSRNRFFLLTKFLHFVNNKNLLNSGYDRKIGKVAPVVDHCNRKFAELYTPSQYLSLDESFLLWKGRSSQKKYIRTKTARFGIKSFELCEANTGYLLQYRLYSGKGTAMHPETSHSFTDESSKVVLELMNGYMDVGHILVMDNWYNQLPLMRYLKSRRTDVLGTLDRRRTLVPQALKDLIPNQMERGESVARHCGDIALVAWKDEKFVTVTTTYHQYKMVMGKRAGQAMMKSTAAQDYNRYKGGIDIKDQKLSKFPIERIGNPKWYMKVFRRLLDSSLLNAHIICTHNPMFRSYSYREIRLQIAEGLISRCVSLATLPSSVLNYRQGALLRLDRRENHFPIYTEKFVNGKKKQIRCVRCAAHRKRVLVNTQCKACLVALCIGACWEEYHTV